MILARTCLIAKALLKVNNHQAITNHVLIHLCIIFLDLDKSICKQLTHLLVFQLRIIKILNSIMSKEHIWDNFFLKTD